jgi:hypothetical protein
VTQPSAQPRPADPQRIKRWQQLLASERDAALLYTRLSKAETGERRLGRPAALAATAILLAGVAGCASAAHPQGAASGPASVRVPASPGGVFSPTPAASPAATWPVTLPVPPVRAGLHQTRGRPVAAGAVFAAEMTDLWAAVASGWPRLALPSFFPLIAYEQVKAIADPAADWRSRLWGEFTLDVMAAHALLGAQARHARLVKVIVPEAEAAWIVPGVCYNGVGYWHVAGSRLVYRAGGQERSIGIASLISWRGLWYVVHFGGVTRTSAGGMVDEPAFGPGVTGPKGGC